ncbi:hypothetical protein [Phytohabitans flavus]
MSTFVTDWARLSVSHCQYEVTAVPGASGVGIYALGDDLLHVNGPNEFTGFCGIHTGWIEARVRVLPGPPADVDAGWDAISEATLWCPSGLLSVIGLMGGTAEALTDVAVPPGLIRVRVHARHRLHETVRTDDDPPEQHELHVWAVSEETPWRTVLDDPGDATGSRSRRRPPSGRCCHLYRGRPAVRPCCRRCHLTRTRTTPACPGWRWSATGPRRSRSRWECCPPATWRSGWSGSTARL